MKVLKSALDVPHLLVRIHHASDSSALPAAPEASLEPSRPFGYGDFMVI